MVALLAPAAAADLTLNDLPAVIDTLRGCHTVLLIKACDLDDADVSASIRADARFKVWLHYRDASHAVDTYGAGATVNEAVRMLADRLNAIGKQTKRTVEALGPLLPTQ